MESILGGRNMLEKTKAFVYAILTFLGYYGVPETVNQFFQYYNIYIAFDRNWFITIGIVAAVLEFLKIFFSKTHPRFSGGAGIINGVVAAYYIYTVILMFSVIRAGNYQITIGFELFHILVILNLGLWILYNAFVIVHKTIKKENGEGEIPEIRI